MAAEILNIKPRDRLSFAAFFAASLHVGIVLGIGFGFEPMQSSAPTLDITLAKVDDEVAPDDADFLAQSNQLGSGSLDTAQDTRTTHEADFADNVVQEVSETGLPPIPERVEAGDEAVLTTATRTDSMASTDESVDAPDLPPPDVSDYSQITREIASLDARLAAEAQTDAKGPRVRRLTSASARATHDAYYLNAWVRKVERVGNLNYPSQARTDKLYGSLRLLVTISPDGKLQDVRVLESSGHQVLDDAATNIVRLAAPYAPFPPEMRRTTDVLEIVRTWQFRKNTYSSG